MPTATLPDIDRSARWFHALSDVGKGRRGHGGNISIYLDVSTGPSNSALTVTVTVLALIASAAQAGCSRDRKSTRLNSSHGYISYAVFCLKKKKKTNKIQTQALRRKRSEVG